METWLTTIAPRRIRRSTLETTYAPKVRNRIIPGLGKHRLDRLTPEHVERFYTRLETEGLAPATVLQIHRILSRALKVAIQRGYVARNVATLVDAPSASHERDRAADPRGSASGFSGWPRLGGTAPGGAWLWPSDCGRARHSGCDGGTSTSTPERSRSAGSSSASAWRHGCADPHACGKDRHRDHCPPGCTRHARACPQRTGGGLQLTELKSDKSRRTIALPAPLMAALKAHRASSSKSA